MPRVTQRGRRGTDELERTSAKWAAPGAGERYARSRWARRGARDARCVTALLAQHAPGARLVLDVPAGAGRLVAAIGPERWLGGDASLAMLAALPAMLATRTFVGRAERLPLRTGSVDVLVCCRLLHHLAAAEARQAVLAECGRVARSLVLASFWDASAWPTWRRRLRLSAPDGGGRRALSRGAFASDATSAGLEVVAFAADRRFVSPQTFAVLRPRAPAAP